MMCVVLNPISNPILNSFSLLHFSVHPSPLFPRQFFFYFHVSSMYRIYVHIKINKSYTFFIQLYPNCYVSTHGNNDIILWILQGINPFRSESSSISLFSNPSSLHELLSDILYSKHNKNFIINICISNYVLFNFLRRKESSVDEFQDVNTATLCLISQDTSQKGNFAVRNI